MAVGNQSIQFMCHVQITDLTVVNMKHINLINAIQNTKVKQTLIHFSFKKTIFKEKKEGKTKPS